ncbi:MAG: carbohydrate ABC transporter permease, partial [Spirochaetaceae bacterium]|nr:carbohydrate ABC transporter permease [Spirochaetaceae bacterium]
MQKKQYLYTGIGYLIVGAWVLFTFVLIGWVFFASLSTSSEIFSNHMFQFRTGFHFENYVKAWTTQKVSVFFMNSLLYTLVSCAAVVIIAAPAAYALSRFRFAGSGFIQNMFAAALGIPVIMIIMPLFGMVSALRLTNNRWVLMLLYTAMNVPFGVFFLLAFFRNLSFTYEEAAAIDGCSPIGTFWRIMFPL